MTTPAKSTTETADIEIKAPTGKVDVHNRSFVSAEESVKCHCDCTGTVAASGTVTLPEKERKRLQADPSSYKVVAVIVENNPPASPPVGAPETVITSGTDWEFSGANELPNARGNKKDPGCANIIKAWLKYTDSGTGAVTLLADQNKPFTGICANKAGAPTPPVA
jgi:hypothetical protein